MKEKILKHLKELMAMKSLSYSAGENESAEYFINFFEELPYFKEHPEHFGCYEIPGDPFGRKIPYGLLLGKTKETVLLSGHFDVVSTEEYGVAEEYAYGFGEELLECLQSMHLEPRAEADLKSGEWLFGRGSCDMKGGLAIHAALFEKYAEYASKGELEGSIVFMLVPDEESYSAGMRWGAKLLSELKAKYSLNYKLMIDPEPTALEDGKQTMSIGSVGKSMPAIIVQGKKGHSGHFFEGLSALSVISSIYDETNGSLEFCENYGSEMTMPPTWFNMRDMKPVYDVSIPYRAYGFFTVFSLNNTPEDIICKVKKIAENAFEREIAKVNRAYNVFKEKGAVAGDAEVIEYQTKVLTFEELCESAKLLDGFEEFYEGLYEEILIDVEMGKLNYPDATIRMMEEVLNFSNLKMPLAVVGFAPPFYPPVHSDKVNGKENYGSAAFDFVNKVSIEKFGQPMYKENFFMGISDLSYSAVTSPFDYETYGRNTPLWGRGYTVDFDAIEDIAIPSVIYGPIGREYHQYTERVNKKSLLEVVPEVTKKLIEYMWKL